MYVKRNRKAEMEDKARAGYPPAAVDARTTGNNNSEIDTEKSNHKAAGCLRHSHGYSFAGALRGFLLVGSPQSGFKNKRSESNGCRFGEW